MQHTELISSFDQAAMIRFSNRAAGRYDRAAVLAREILDRMIERLTFIKMIPKIIVDVGCGTGLATPLLNKRYPAAKIISVDIAIRMLQQNKHNYGLGDCVQGDAYQLPLKTHSVDLIFANLLLYSLDHLVHVLSEWQRVLKPQGLLMFSTFGSDTLQELRACCETADHRSRTYSFTDLHDVGDVLLQTHFIDPVIDQEHLVLNYRNISRLWQDLQDQGAQYALRSRCDSLSSRQSFERIEQCYEQYRTADGLLPATFAVVYGQAFGSGILSRKNARGEVTIPLYAITKHASDAS